MLKVACCIKLIRNTWKVLKCSTVGGEHWLDGSCEKQSVTQSQGAEEYNKKKDG